MKTFTAWQYLLMEAATQHSQGKETFETRIQWAKDNLHHLESLQDTAEEPALYAVAVMAIRKVQAGKPIGTLVSMDAVCSGLQLMSVLSGDLNAARMTGLVDSNRRPDAYTDMTGAMNKLLQKAGMAHVAVSRGEAKEAVMTAFYASTAVPKRIFGEGTQELDVFYKSLEQEAPGPWALVKILVKAWNPKATAHCWVMPDGFEAVVPVEVMDTARIEVEELDGTSFTYRYAQVAPLKKGLSLAANVVHSVDAYVARCMHRRLNYNPWQFKAWEAKITETLLERVLGTSHDIYEESHTFLSGWLHTGLVDVNILDYAKIEQLPTDMLQRLLKILHRSLADFPVQLVTVHDDYKCHPNGMNRVREEYKEILGEIADADLMEDLLEQLGVPGYKKLSRSMGNIIRSSSYALT